MIEKTIINALLHNENFTRKVIPFIDEKYFDPNSPERIVFNVIKKYFTEHNNLPPIEAILVEVDSKKLVQPLFESVIDFVDDVKKKTDYDEKWLLEKTEKFCKDKAIVNALMESIQIHKGEKKGVDRGAIPEILSNALAVSFDLKIGQDYFEDAEKRYEFYHRLEEKLDFDIELLNVVTDGGLRKKTLTVFMAATGGCKSLTMCHIAVHNLLQGRNVLYITLELSEDHVNERIDANILDVSLNELKNLSRNTYLNKIHSIQKKTRGKLIVKEYPTGSASVIHFRHLLSELKIKKDFVPDIIFVDYINICACASVRLGGSVNSYTYIKKIAEELRGLAVEYDLPVVTATQSNRDAYGSTDVDIENVSESIGLPQTTDFMFGLLETEEMKEMGQIMIKQLKNRYGDPNKYNKFVVGIDKSKMRLYNVRQEDYDNEDNIDNDKPIFDGTQFGTEDKLERLKNVFR